MIILHPLYFDNLPVCFRICHSNMQHTSEWMFKTQIKLRKTVRTLFSANKSLTAMEQWFRNLAENTCFNDVRQKCMMYVRKTIACKRIQAIEMMRDEALISEMCYDATRLKLILCVIVWCRCIFPIVFFFAFSYIIVIKNEQQQQQKTHAKSICAMS